MENTRNKSWMNTRMACLVAGLILYVAGGLSAETIGLIHPLQPNRKVAQAVELLSEGHLKEADAVFAQVTESEPGYLDATLGRAQIAISEQELDKADRMVTAVLKSNDRLPEAHNMKGVVLILRKDPAGAQREFLRALELRPQYVTPRVYLAVLARLRGDYATAAAEYKALTIVAPRLPAGYLGQAEAQMLLHHQDEALKILEGWKGADPKSLLPYQVLANVDLADHQPREAIKQLEAALAKNPNDSATLTILGTACADAGDLQSASNHYEEALIANPANIDASLRLATLEAGMGQTDRALTQFRVVLKADPNNVVACNNVAWLLASEGRDMDEALRLAVLATKRDPQYVDAEDTLGWVRYRRGEYALAVATLKKAKALAPANTDIAAHLGLAYAKTGDKRDALLELNRALKSGGTISNRPELERVVAELSANSASVRR